MSNNLHGNILIAMPHLIDPRFQKSVILICEFSKKHVMGLILNKEIKNINLNDLTKKLNIPKSNPFKNDIIFNGGPVYTGQGFILHSSDMIYKNTEQVIDNICLTTSIEILEDFCMDKGPREIKIFLGCSVWTYEQFNQEILDNSWLTMQGNKDIIFNDTPLNDLWKMCIKNMGINEEKLVTSFGHA